MPGMPGKDGKSGPAGPPGRMNKNIFYLVIVCHGV